MLSIKSCPLCGKQLETVTTSDDELLGYFCPNIIDNSCSYTDTVSRIEFEIMRNASKKTENRTEA